MSENALKEFKVKHAAGIAATKAEFVEFLRKGELPEGTLDSVALYIHIANRAALKGRPESKPVPAGEFFASIVEDGDVYSSLDHWDNPKKYAALDICPNCDGEGHVSKATAQGAKLKTNKKRVRGV
jgi:hypothetical protein